MPPTAGQRFTAMGQAGIDQRAGWRGRGPDATTMPAAVITIRSFILEDHGQRYNPRVDDGASASARDFKRNRLHHAGLGIS